MDFRHLQRFIAVAEELHFSRAAERLHMEQSPLSRSIKDLEADLGASLFDRCARGTQLTHAGRALLEAVPRILTAIEQARKGVESAAAGHQSILRVALSDGIDPHRLAAILAKSREQEPTIEIRLFEVSLSQQLRGLSQDLYDVGFCGARKLPDGLIAHPLWRSQLVVTMPLRHPLLEYAYIPAIEVLSYPLVRFSPCVQTSLNQHIDDLIGSMACSPKVAEHTVSIEVLIALITAGYGVGFMSEEQIRMHPAADVVTRPLAGQPTYLTTYLLKPSSAGESPHVARFVERVLGISAE